MARPIAAIVCSIALGSLVFSARLAPLVFEALPNDRALAGRLAGRAFESAYWLAAVAAAVALAVAVTARSLRFRLETAVAAVMAVAAMLQVGWLAPSIARHGDGWPGSFGSLHRVAGLVHLALAVLALILAWLLVSRGVRE